MAELRNSWPGGYQHAMHQLEHKSWNASHYPGTRQLCSICEQPTGRCEEDSMRSHSGEPLCEECNMTHGRDGDDEGGEGE
jgi:hypothetical protein